MPWLLKPAPTQPPRTTMATAGPQRVRGQRPTHFIALRVNDPLLTPALARVQAQVSGE